MQKRNIRANNMNPDIPISSANSLVIPGKSAGFGFPLLTEMEGPHFDELPTSRINSTLRQLNKQIDIELVNKKLDEGKNFHAAKLGFVHFLFAIGVLSGFIMYMLVLFDVNEFKTKFIYIPLAFLLVCVLLSIIVLFSALMTRREHVNVDQQILITCRDLLNHENRTYYLPKAFSLEADPKLRWLVLSKLA